MPTTDPTPDPDAFIARWRASSAAERTAAFPGPAGKRSTPVVELLATLAALGQAVVVEEGRHAG